MNWMIGNYYWNGKGKKRAAPPPPESQTNKAITDRQLYETRAANVSSKSVEGPMFVSATEMAAKTYVTVQIIPELSDEEPLAMVIQFEKEHPQ